MAHNEHRLSSLRTEEGTKQAVKKIAQWENEGFVRINNALTESGIIPKLHAVFEEAGIANDIGYLVFDAYETSRGFPVPVRTRYIMPSGEGIPFPEEGEIYPGLAISEILGLGARSIEIQVGLDSEDLRKVGVRARAIKRKEPEWSDTREAPTWWPYPYLAVDMSEPYDLNNDTKAALSAIAASGGMDKAEKHSLWDVYVWGKYNPHPKAVVFDFEYEDAMGGDAPVKHYGYLDKMKQGLQNTRELLGIT